MENLAPSTTALLKCQSWPPKQLVTYTTVTTQQKLRVTISQPRNKIILYKGKLGKRAENGESMAQNKTG